MLLEKCSYSCPLTMYQIIKEKTLGMPMLLSSMPGEHLSEPHPTPLFLFAHVKLEIRQGSQSGDHHCHHPSQIKGKLSWAKLRMRCRCTLYHCAGFYFHCIYHQICHWLWGLTCLACSLMGHVHGWCETRAFQWIKQSYSYYSEWREDGTMEYV